MSNNSYGTKREREVRRQFEKLDNIDIKQLDGTVKNYQIERVLSGGSSNSVKADIIISPAIRFSFKALGKGDPSIINMTSAKQFEQLAISDKIKQYIDTIEAIRVIDYLVKLGKVVKLSTIANKEEWREILDYFMFDGSGRGACDKLFTATELLIEKSDKSLLAVSRSEAVDYIWDKLTVEIRYRDNDDTPRLQARIS